MFNRTTFPLSSDNNGLCLVILNPYATFFGPTAASASNLWYPWLTIGSPNQDSPLNGNSYAYKYTQQYPGPFVPQMQNIQGFFPDLSTMRFECTLAPIQRSGAVATTVFYEAWNNASNLFLNQSYNGLTLQLSQTDVDSNVSVTKQYLM